MKGLKGLFKRKEKKLSKRQQKLLDMWNRGQYLRVGEDVDNKKLILEAE